MITLKETNLSEAVEMSDQRSTVVSSGAPPSLSLSVLDFSENHTAPAPSKKSLTAMRSRKRGRPRKQIALVEE